MASIRQRDGKWQARVIRKGYPAETKSFDTRAQAARWAREIEGSIDRRVHQSYGDIDTLPLRELMARYVAEVSPTKRGGKDEAIRIRALQRHRLGAFTLETLAPSDIAALRDQRLRSVGAGTVVRELALLSAIINHARREWGAAVPNPCALVRRPRVPTGRTRLLSDDEQTRLLNELAPLGRRNPLMRPLVLLALETAMRRGELLALKWRHVDLPRQIATLERSKNGDGRTVPLSRRAVEVLQALGPQEPNEAVFPIGEAALHAAFKRACRRADLVDFHFHDLRHCAATSLSTKLSNVLELSAVTGHRTLQMLKRYYHPDASQLAAKLG